MNTREAIEQNPVLSDEDKKALLGAVCTRGRYKGYLLTNAPSPAKRPIDWLAWQVLVGHLAPVRISIAGLFFNRSDAYIELDKRTEKAGLTFALNTCEPAYRWNLWANRYDRERGQVELKQLYKLKASKK